MKKLRRRRHNYMGDYLTTQLHESKFIRFMFKEYGVALRRLKDVRVKNCLDKEHVSVAFDPKNRHYRIFVDYKMASPQFFNLLVHEICHVLHMMNATQDCTCYWNYEHDPEEHEATLWEMRYLKKLGNSKANIIEHISKGLIKERYPDCFLDVLWTTMV